MPWRFKSVRAFGEEGRTVSLYRLRRSIGLDIGYAKLKLALEILSDVGLIRAELLPTGTLSGSELYRIGAERTTDKVNLFGAPRYKNVKSRFIKG